MTSQLPSIYNINCCNRGVFQNFPLQLLLNCTELIIHPFIVCVTTTVRPFIPTTREKCHPHKLLTQRVLVSPVFFIVALLLLLPAIVAFSLRSLMFQFRWPFCVTSSNRYIHYMKNQSKADCDISNKNVQTFGVVTANICLLPELLSKVNNLDNSANRARTIGERIVIDQMFYSGKNDFPKNISPSVDNRRQTRSATKAAQSNNMGFHNNHNAEFNHDVVTHFSKTDFLCLQETFDRDYTQLLITELGKIYPWIVHDAGNWKPSINCCMLNSGLMFASRYEILDVCFKPFTAKCGFATFISQGLLMVKVNIGAIGKPSRRQAGYIFNTHIQAFQGDKPVVEQQLSDIVHWTSSFRTDTQMDGEHVVFDILCGDFNIDNMSPGESHLADHELFTVYTDVCRERHGKDKDWTIGTEFRISKLQDEAVSTPEGLKVALDDMYLRQHYIIDADLESTTMDAILNASVKTDHHGNMMLSPVGGRRRIDLVLYRQNKPVNVEAYNFVTRLASLTDHVPVSMTYNC